MMHRSIRVLIAAALLLTPAAARADWFAQPFAGVNAGGATTKESAVFGVSGGWLGRWYGGEGEVAWSPWFFADDSGFREKHRSTTVTGTALAGPRLGNARPYGAFGLGMLRSEIAEVGGLATLTDTRPAMHAGGGLMWSVRGATLRADARYIRALDDQEAVGNVFPERLANIDYWRVGGGVAFTW